MTWDLCATLAMRELDLDSWLSGARYLNKHGVGDQSEAIGILILDEGLENMTLRGYVDNAMVWWAGWLFAFLAAEAEAAGKTVRNY